jgi:hypothetical protein
MCAVAALAVLSVRRFSMVRIALPCILVFAVSLAAFAGEPLTPAPKDPRQSPYGVNNWDWGPRECRMIRESGARWVRIMVDWARWEPTEGNINWTWLDNAVKNADEAGLAINFSYYHTPGWAMMPGGRSLGRPEAMARFAGALAARYKGVADAQEIYNEDVAGQWPHVAERNAWVYVPVLQACYKAIKAADPDQLVLAGGLWQNPMYYVEDMYKAGAKGYFDALNWHFYIGSQHPSVLDAFRGDYVFPLFYLRKVSEKYGDPKPIWITEVGWTVSRENQAAPVSLEEQAANLEYAYRKAMETGLVDKIFWYVFYMQDGMSLIHRNDTSDRFGPSAAADYRRPAYQTMLDFIATYPTWNASVVRPQTLPEAAQRPASIVNAGFESTEGWTLPDGAERVREPHKGEWALRLTGAGQTIRAPSAAFEVEPGKCYEVRGWVKVDGGWDDSTTGHVMWDIEMYGADGQKLNMDGPLRDNRHGNWISTNYYVNETFGKWQEIQYPVIVPAEARTVRLVARLSFPVSSAQGARRGAAPATQPARKPTVALFDDVSMIPLDVRPGK